MSYFEPGKNNLIGQKYGDPLNLFGNNGPGTPPTTPQEQQAYDAAQPFLAEYNSGKLDPANKALVQQADTNSTEAALQSFANSGMISSSSRMQTTGVVKPGNANRGLQAGAGSNIDVAKASNTQQILTTDLNNALAYLGVAAGDAQALTAVNLQQNQNIVDALGAASQAFGKIYGSQPGTTSGLTQVNEAQQVNDAANFSTSTIYQPDNSAFAPGFP